MRLISLVAAVGAGSLALASAQAQQTNVTPAGDSAKTTVDTTVAPPPEPAPLKQPVPSDAPATAYSFVAPDGATHVMVQLPPVVQNVPPPAASYPLCIKGRRDSCRNPGEG